MSVLRKDALYIQPTQKDKLLQNSSSDVPEDLKGIMIHMMITTLIHILLSTIIAIF